MKICDMAVNQYGFSHAGGLQVETIHMLPEIREMCAVNRCGMYGKTWTCPPAIGGPEEMQTRIRGYTGGILVQTTGDLEDDFDYESMKDTEAKHQRNFQKLCGDLKKKFPEILPMAAGACTACSKCTYPDQPCRFPDRAYPSMEAYGIFVSQLCADNGIAYYYGPRTMTFVSCILFA